MRRNNIYLSVSWGGNVEKEILEIINYFLKVIKGLQLQLQEIHWVLRGKIGKLENISAKKKILKGWMDMVPVFSILVALGGWEFLKNHVMVVCTSLCFVTNYFIQWLKTIFYFSWFCESSGWFYCYCYLCSCNCIFLMGWLEASLDWDSWVSLSMWSFILDFFTAQWSWGTSGSWG